MQPNNFEMILTGAEILGYVFFFGPIIAFAYERYCLSDGEGTEWTTEDSLFFSVGTVSTIVHLASYLF
jgi:hypothetical protein